MRCEGRLRILRRRDGRRRQDNVGQVVGYADNPLRFALVSREELEQVLQLPRALILQETLGTARLAWVPAELRPSTIVFGLLADDKRIPCLVNERLVQQAVDDSRVHPVTLGHARLKMTSNMLDVTLTGGVQGRAETTRPVLALTQELDNLLGVRTSLAAVALLMVLVERIGTPEATVTSRLRAGILPPALVELIFMSFPVVLSLEARFARGTPIDVGLASGTIGTTEGTGRRSRRGGDR